MESYQKALLLDPVQTTRGLCLRSVYPVAQFIYILQKTNSIKLRPGNQKNSSSTNCGAKVLGGRSSRWT
jgi:hypothetical protein